MNKRPPTTDARIQKVRDPAYAPTIVDLFSGCGGMSLGFERAGFKVVVGVEREAVRAKTHHLNFGGIGAGAQLNADGDYSLDATAPDSISAVRAQLGNLFPNVDVVIGGPPCQAYARVGRAKLREIGNAPDAHLKDERGSLYAAYITWVRELKPLAVVMENVPDILSFGGVNVADVIAEQLDELGYECRYTLLNAANYGVPQTRERWYLIGIDKRFGVVPTFPAPTHHVELPPGYRGTRAIAGRWTESDRPRHAELLQAVSPDLPPAITCEDALSDLPAFRGEDARNARGMRDLKGGEPYRLAPTNEYQRLMRSWNAPQGEVNESVTAQVTRALPRDYDLFRIMPEGADYPKLHALALERFNKHLHRLAKERGSAIAEESAEHEQLRAAMVPPYDPGKFPNKWRKLRRDFPSHTLMAHLGHDTYSHIHYDSDQGRTITVREAARLQSFPDDFQFAGAMNAAFAQIGNAVPPLMASALASHLRSTLKAGAGAPIRESQAKRSRKR